jgi:SSS family solute:Na+ symporter
MQQGSLNFSLSNADQALPAMITQLLPVGLKGIAIAGLLAALMSSLSSAFNSSSTLLTIDFYQKFNPDASEKQLVRFGQLATVTLVFISMGWIPFMKALMGGGIFYYLQSIQAYVSPPIAAVFLLGLMYQWVNAKAAIITLWSGFALGMLRLVLEYVAGADIMQFSQGSLFNLLLEINFLHYAILLFVISVTILVTVSKLTPPPNLNQIQGLCLQTSEKRKIVWSSMDVRLSMGLIGLVLILWFVFSKWGIA